VVDLAVANSRVRIDFFGLWLWAVLGLTIALHERTNIVQHFWTGAAAKNKISINNVPRIF